MTMTLTDPYAYVAGYPVGEILSGFVECAFWSSTDRDDEPMDANYGADDLTPDAVAIIEADVLTFARRAWYAAEAAGWEAGQFGHDYWLTRNGHGAGFWCREWDTSNVGRRLSDLATSMGTMDLYVDPDGKVDVE